MSGPGPWYAVVEMYGGPLDGERRTFVLPLGGAYRVPVVAALSPFAPMPVASVSVAPTRHVYRLRPWPGRMRYEYAGDE